MKIRPLTPKDRARIHSILVDSRAFSFEEIDVAMELVDIVLKDPNQEDYQIDCIVDSQDHPLGYVCYGRVPMTQGTFDLYWIAVDPELQGQGIGSRLVDFMEGALRGTGGRMILADTSSIPEYEKTRRFYREKGFQEVARISDYYHEGNDRITFCKRLR